MKGPAYRQMKSVVQVSMECEDSKSESIHPDRVASASFSLRTPRSDGLRQYTSRFLLCPRDASRVSSPRDSSASYCCFPYLPLPRPSHLMASTNARKCRQSRTLHPPGLCGDPQAHTLAPAQPCHTPNSTVTPLHSHHHQTPQTHAYIHLSQSQHQCEYPRRLPVP
ncbi:hypothetical protein L210DRAFT_3535696 [Boletus edulis BED1]|uniref:Uncharacterized protein n=1 Tax=Boletus edulis BED1 TaxID=1328754 RepID=A0AAD4BWG3_BOLED|nr:hypothetical protein L210DRAFT_3535696 [Boletus edulis BED1]